MSPTKRWLINCSGGGEYSGPFLAVLEVDREQALWLLKQFELMRRIKRLDHAVDRFTKSGVEPRFFENCGLGTPYSPGETAQVAELFDSPMAEQAESEDWAALPDWFAIPAHGVRTDYCSLEVMAFNDSEPTLYWRMRPRHSSEEIETATINEFAVQLLLASFTPEDEATPSPAYFRNGDMTIHPDWYCDGGESGEQLWRLDFRHGDNAFQAQLFARIRPEQCDAHGGVLYAVSVVDEEYVSFRLLLERDNRDADGERIDYACDAWPLEPARALQLLAAATDDLPELLHAELEAVAALPCDIP